MGMGWEQLEQPGAATDAHQPSRLFGTLFAAHPSMPHAELESENGTAIWAGCAVVSAAHNLRTHVGDR